MLTNSMLQKKVKIIGQVKFKDVYQHFITRIIFNNFHPLLL